MSKSKPPSPNAELRSLSSLPPCAGGLSRRDFCAVAGAGLVTLGLSACGSGSGAADLPDLAGPTGPDLSGGSASCPAGSVAAGSAASLTAGTYMRMSGGGTVLFVCRDAAGLFAMDARCTHEGQTLTKQPTRLYCSRHGATFDLNGENPTGPAGSPLDHYAVCVDTSGNIFVDTNTVVDPTTRV